MTHAMVPPLEQLVDAFSRLPSIGRKSAWRLVLHLMERPPGDATALAALLQNLHEQVRLCRDCFNYTQDELCAVCSDTRRDADTICVVEKPTDLFSIERAGRYRGLYHVLGGVISPINGVTPERLRIGELVERVQQRPFVEVILALGGSADAETTSLYLGSVLGGTDVRLTRLARGVPAGMDLEYIDQITLAQALAERTALPYGERRE